MRKPTIHMNGSNGQSLFDGYYAALEAVQAAQKALAACAPHGRDYYVQEGDATNEAIEEHRARYVALAKVEDDLLTLALHVQETGAGVKR